MPSWIFILFNLIQGPSELNLLEIVFFRLKCYRFIGSDAYLIFRIRVRVWVWVWIKVRVKVRVRVGVRFRVRVSVRAIVEC